MKCLQKFSMAKSRIQSHKGVVYILLTVLLTLAVLCSLSFGSTDAGLGDLFSLLAGQGGRSGDIILYVRLPRTLGALLTGTAMAVSGVIIQGVLANPLAGPNLIGVNAGAGLAAILCSALLPSMHTAVPAAAFGGALAASLLVFFLARKTGASRITLVLAGVAISGILSAVIDTVATINPDALVGANAFMVGGLSGVMSKDLILPGILILAAAAGAWLLSYELDLLSLGDEVASSLGLPVRRYRFLLLSVASMLAGSAVSFAGLIGFVGLIVPHAARFFVGEENKRLIPAAALLGALMVVVCDLLARILFAPFELPVGILLSLLGGPFFLWLLIRQRGGRMHD
ncbi:iron ABC transporter permease [Anaerolentibacter hominis]|uniref:FecCD family ABC transporter permease n=1 Tax=Anaerolentibacter hominis TaxID=3079009 RepID=UPI0031B7F1F0